MREIGKLHYINPRELWEHEAQEFTPWLCEHLDELGAALGVNLEIITRETRVGSFSCDIFARDAKSKRKVIIENQLEATDHSHLGQLMTYAAGLEADIVCWISPEFRDEHKLAIEWLNNHTTEDIQFIAIRLRALQIGDSLPAPLFEVVARPNSYQRDTKRQEGNSELAKFYGDFWKDVLEQAKIKGLYQGSQRTGCDNFIGFPSGSAGFIFYLSFAKGNIYRVEVYIDHGKDTQELNEHLFNELYKEKAEIESELDYELSWQRLEHARACRISADRMYSDRETERNDLLAWSMDMLSKMKTTFGPRIERLKRK